MGNLFASFNTGVSGLKSAQTSLNTAAHNLANATTEGHTRQQVMVTDAYYTKRYGAYSNKMDIGLGTNVAQIRQVRNRFLDAQYRLQLGRQNFYEAQYNAVQEMEELFGELEAQQFSGALSDLWNSFQELAKTPNDITCRAELISVSSQFMERAQVLQHQLNEYQSNMNQEVQNQVNKVNELVTGVKEYNALIRRYEATGEGANDYRDARNLLLDQLSEIITYKAIEEVDGTVSLYTEGAYLLEATKQHFLATDVESAESKLLKPIWETGEDFFYRGELSYSASNDTDTGSLRGLLVARGNYAADYTDMPVRPKLEGYTNEAGIVDEVAWFNANEQFERDVENYNQYVEPSIVMKVQAQFDQFIRGIAMMVNDTLCPNKTLELADGSKITVLDTDLAPRGDDADNTMGTELFVRRHTPRYEEKLVSVLDEEGVAQKITVYQYIEEDEGDRYTMYTVDQMEVNPDLLKNPSKLPLTANPNTGFVDGFTQFICTDLLEKWQKDFSTLDPNSMTNYDFTGYYGALVGQFATSGNVWKGIVDNQNITVNALEAGRQNVMGVSTDEELADLIRFQKCYDASSRYITVVDQMIEHLLNSL